MLVLSRQVEESVVVGDGYLRVTILEIRGNKVRLGFEAAVDVPVHREEVFLAIKKEQDEDQQERSAPGS